MCYTEFIWQTVLVCTAEIWVLLLAFISVVAADLLRSQTIQRSAGERCMPVRLQTPRCSSRHGWIHDNRTTRMRSVAAELKERKNPAHKFKPALDSKCRIRHSSCLLWLSLLQQSFFFSFLFYRFILYSTLTNNSSGQLLGQSVG